MAIPAAAGAAAAAGGAAAAAAMPEVEVVAAVPVPVVPDVPAAAAGGAVLRIPVPTSSDEEDAEQDQVREGRRRQPAQGSQTGGARLEKRVSKWLKNDPTVKELFGMFREALGETRECSSLGRRIAAALLEEGNP